MPFTPKVKGAMFEKCLRICCLCLEPCDIGIEAAHIIDESKGGPNTEDNGIPVCHGCHLKMGHYNDKHPLGNKFRPAELKARRDQVYKLVESGAMHAMLVAAHLRAAGGELVLEAAQLKPPPVSDLAADYVKRIAGGDVSYCTEGRLGLLSETDRSVVLDQLIDKSPVKVVTTSLMQLANSAYLPVDERQVIVDRVVLKLALNNNISITTELLSEAPPKLFRKVPVKTRRAIFQDVISAMQTDQYDTVNALVPSVVKHLSAIPRSLMPAFVQAVFRQTRSSGFKSRPAALEILGKLSEDMARASLALFTRKYLCLYGNQKDVRSFVEKFGGLAEGRQSEIFKEFAKLGYNKFCDKYEKQ